MKKVTLWIGAHLIMLMSLLSVTQPVVAQTRRPIDARHPAWLVHIDVWNAANPQRIIDLIPEDVRPYVIFNLSMSCQYDTEKNVYKMPQNAILTYRSWASVCCRNNVFFTCQPASGGHTHIQDTDLGTFESFYKDYKNFLGWNYAEQFWGFDVTGDKSSSTQESRIALFANLVPMAHKYGGFLTLSFCGNKWSHSLSPIGMLKRNNDFLKACKQYPEAMIFTYKYTLSGCFHNAESCCLGPFVSGLTKNYGIRYDRCGWCADAELLGGKGHTYPSSAGIGTFLEQAAVNGACVFDGPETIPDCCFREVGTTQVNGYTRRQWQMWPEMENVWVDLFRKIIDGTIHINTREEVISRTKVVMISDVAASQDNDGLKQKAYATPNDLYDGLYLQDDPYNHDDRYMMNNGLYLKKTGRYAAIPLVTGLYDDLARSIPVQVKRSEYESKWATTADKVKTFNAYYPDVPNTGDLFVSRNKNELTAYTPYSYYNSKKTAAGTINLKYNTCKALRLTLSELCGAMVREYADHINVYVNNFRTDTTTLKTDIIQLTGCSTKPTYTYSNRSVYSKSKQLAFNESFSGSTYRLEVTHLGGVDISIQCSGSATGRSTDLLDDTPLEAPAYPDLAESTRHPLIIEAEDMDRRNVKAATTSPYYQYPDERGHSGNGFVEMGTNRNASLRDSVDLYRDGHYEVAIRYMALTSTTLTVAINGRVQNISLPTTGNNVWQTATVESDMAAGKNAVLLNMTTGVNVYLDNVTYTRLGDATAISLPKATVTNGPARHYDLNGMEHHGAIHGLDITRQGGTTKKMIRK